METSLRGALLKMGSNFLVAAFVPAMAFIVTSLITFGPLLPAKYRIDFLSNWQKFAQPGIILLILFITILGFTLYSLSIYIYKTFEGYSFFLAKNNALRRSFLRRQKSRFNKAKAKIALIEKQLEQIDKKIDREPGNYVEGSWREKRLERYIKHRKRLESFRYAFISECDEKFPPSIELIMPTRFGNILRAAEMYPWSRYSIDAVPLWGRLAHVISKDGMDKIDEANNQCLFLLNASVLATIYSVLCLFTSVYHSILWLAKVNNIPMLPSDLINCLHTASNSCLAPIYQARIVIYIALAILAIMVAWFFYEASLLNVGQFGSMIRTAYDLYRFKLIEALHLELPTTITEEKRLWRDVSNFMVGYDEWKSLKILEIMEKYKQSPASGFVYHHPEK